MEEHSAIRRREILVAAQKVFDASGYAATTMEAVASAAGIAKGSIYNYFDSKHELFAQVFTQANAGTEQELGPVLAGSASASEKLAAMLDHWFQQFAANKRIGRLLLEFWTTAAREGLPVAVRGDGNSEQPQGQISGFLREAFEHWRGLLADVIRQGVREGRFDALLDATPDSAPAAATMVLAMLHGMQLHAILELGTTVDDAMAQDVKRMVIERLMER